MHQTEGFTVHCTVQYVQYTHVYSARCTAYYGNQMLDIYLHVFAISANKSQRRKKAKKLLVDALFRLGAHLSSDSIWLKFCTEALER